MFIIMKKRRTNMMDAIMDCISLSVRSRSLKPLTWIVRKGRYGANHQLRGNFLEYKRYCERMNKPAMVVVGK